MGVSEDEEFSILFSSLLNQRKVPPHETRREGAFYMTGIGWCSRIRRNAQILCEACIIVLDSKGAAWDYPGRILSDGSTEEKSGGFRC